MTDQAAIQKSHLNLFFLSAVNCKLLRLSHAGKLYNAPWRLQRTGKKKPFPPPHLKKIIICAASDSQVPLCKPSLQKQQCIRTSAFILILTCVNSVYINITYVSAGSCMFSDQSDLRIQLHCDIKMINQHIPIRIKNYTAWPINKTSKL